MYFDKFQAPSEKDVTGSCELNKHSYSSVNENKNFHEEEGVTFSVFLEVKSPEKFFLLITNYLYNFSDIYCGNIISLVFKTASFNTKQWHMHMYR